MINSGIYFDYFKTLQGLFGLINDYHAKNHHLMDEYSKFTILNIS